MAKTFTAFCVLICAIVGAGYLGLPYVAKLSGYPLTLIHLAIFAIIMALVMLYLGEIMLRTKSMHQLSGYAEKYLGHKGKTIMMISFLIGAYAAMLAFIIAEGESWSQLIFQSADYSILFGIAFWLVVSMLSHGSLKALKESDALAFSLILIMLVSLVLLNFKKISLVNLTYLAPAQILAPIGIVVFSYLGYSIMPEVRRVLQDKESSLKKVIIFVYAAVFLIYAIFTALVLGTHGQSTPEIATLSLGAPFIVLGIITMFTASLSLSNAIMDTFKLDFGATGTHAWLYSLPIPLALYIITLLFGKASFITTLAIGGVISGGITIALILLMVPRAKKMGTRTPEYSMPYSKIAAGIIIALFAIGAIFEIMNLLS